eukprot:TRINITY_DN2362_c0_g1_i1.p1 TRINITY_DN2362_c0_g1~~TRINITY_DN2362_c0_g1_i1.p1  ORF type:complete len:327 (+),score=65.68 TRINITY_DN2362_c0_g1_i1:911-1891(+)
MESERYFTWSKLKQARYFHKLAQTEHRSGLKLGGNNEVLAVKALESIISLFKLANGAESTRKQKRTTIHSSLSPKPSYNSAAKNGSRKSPKGFGNSWRLLKKYMQQSTKTSPTSRLLRDPDKSEGPKSARFPLIKELESAVRKKAKVVAKAFNNSKQISSTNKRNTSDKRINNTSSVTSNRFAPLKAEGKKGLALRSTMPVRVNLRKIQGSYKSSLTPDPFAIDNTHSKMRLNNTLRNNLQNCLHNIRESSAKSENVFEMGRNNVHKLTKQRNNKSIEKAAEVSGSRKLVANSKNKSTSPAPSRAKKCKKSINELKHQFDKLAYQI